MVLTLLLLGLLVGLAASSPPPETLVCAHGTSNCTVSNAYGSFPDRTVCRAPRRSFPKLACPGGSDGTIISTERLNRVVSVDVAKGLMTVESGMVLRDLIKKAATKGLALPHSTYWSGLTIGGLLATGAHGSEYVVGMRIVTPAPASQGFAVVRELCADHPDLDAAKVFLGVLGVVSQVTLTLQPMFKRSVTFVTCDDSDMAEQAAKWGNLHEFGDMAWLPEQRKDDRVAVTSAGDGLNDDSLPFRPAPARGWYGRPPRVD